MANTENRPVGDDAAEESERKPGAHRATGSNAETGGSRWVLPSIAVPHIPWSTAEVTRLMAGLARTPQATLATTLRPFDFQSGWLDQWRGALTNVPDISSVAAQVFKSIDFRFAETAAKLVEGFAAQQESLFSAVASIRFPPPSSYYPANLAGIDDLTLDQIRQVVMDEGIALYGAPRQRTAERLIRAEDSAARRAVLGKQGQSILEDCRAVAATWRSPAVAPYKAPAMAALDALSAGHSLAAQALAGSLVDVIVTSWFGKGSEYVPGGGTTTSQAYDELTIREFIAFAPIWSAHLKFYPGTGDPVPRMFNRHATVHTVSPRQFNRRNAIQGMLLVCGALSFIDHEAVRL
jgi:hypothetical protein